MASADLIRTGRAWASAAAYADTNPNAASALRICEDRLRQLHPFAMARYDRLRDEEDETALEAMRQAAPLFSRAPHACTGEPAPARPAIATTDTDPTADPASDSNNAEPAPDRAQDEEAERAERAEQRGQQIAELL